MNENLKKLFDTKGKIINEMQDAYRDVAKRADAKANAEEKEKFAKWDNDLTDIQEQIELHQRMEKVNTLEEARKAVNTEIVDNKQEKKYVQRVSPLDVLRGEPQITKLPAILVTYVIGEIDAVRGGAAV